MNSGIYEIRNKLNNHTYIGSSVNIKRRWSWHRDALKNNKHHSKYLQRAWNKYGEDNFEFDMLMFCETDKLIENEQYFIDSWKPEYNNCPIAGNTKGRKQSKEFCERQSFRLLGHTLSDETKRKIGIANKGNKPWTYGKHIPKEVAHKISKANIGKKRTPETIEKIRKAKTGISTTKKIYDGFISPDGIEFRNITGLKAFCDERGLNYRSMNRIARGGRKSYRGWRKI